jgi:hypothetical protein
MCGKARCRACCCAVRGASSAAVGGGVCGRMTAAVVTRSGIGGERRKRKSGQHCDGRSDPSRCKMCHVGESPFLSKQDTRCRYSNVRHLHSLQRRRLSRDFVNGDERLFIARRVPRRGNPAGVYFCVLSFSIRPSVG